ncbi:MAG: SpoIVB peptidase [Ruminococcaceae bacterium]|nr:SpoIVB peptidase [Oscillospiraceae bacterium]
MRFIKKLSSCILALSFSALILYADILSEFPAEIIMHQNESHSSTLGLGVSIRNIPDDVCVTSGNDTVTPLKTGTYDATLNVGSIPFKKVKINVSQPKSLYVSGQLIGIRIYNKGLIVTNLAPVLCQGVEISPAQKAGILPGDIILKINGQEVKSAEEVSSVITESTTLTLQRKNAIKTVKVTPVSDDNDGELKLGLWVRDSSAGVGTMTYINPENLTYGALGHGISDSDTGILFNVADGSIEKSMVISVQKGKKGSPGQISGSFSSAGEISGTVRKNCEAGLFGDVFPHSDLCGESYPIGVMSQVKTGDATILSTVDGDVKEYKIKILRTMPYGSASKGLSIEITDPELLDKTGGIVQGMSGSPIIQNGKLIGAVTHVLVNDPTRGYGIFIENMLSEAEKIK